LPSFCSNLYQREAIIFDQAGFPTQAAIEATDPIILLEYESQAIIIYNESVNLPKRSCTSYKVLFRDVFHLKAMSSFFPINTALLFRHL
jgi:hypothetical protein